MKLQTRHHDREPMVIKADSLQRLVKSTFFEDTVLLCSKAVLELRILLQLLPPKDYNSMQKSIKRMSLIRELDREKTEE